MARTPAAKNTIITQDEWTQRLAAVQVSKDDLNELILQHFFHEGYRDAAENFAREAGIAARSVDLDSIENRMHIRHAVQRGDVVEATEMVNELDPEILDTNPALHFHLLQLQLIELIRHGRLTDALSFAQSELAPRGEESPEFLAELERTMALLAFEMPRLGAAPSTAAAAPTATTTAGKAAKGSKKGGKGKAVKDDEAEDASMRMPESIASLLDPAQRIRTATELNAAILTAQSHGKESKLPGLLKMLAWGEEMLSQRAEFPTWDFADLLARKPSAAPSAALKHDEDDLMTL